MIIANKYKIPDKCIKNCSLKPKYLDQSAICCRCPLFICIQLKSDPEGIYTPIVKPENFREDWAKEWQEFFKTGKVPKLKLQFMKNKTPYLEDTRPFGTQIQIYTQRGWVICDNQKEVQEEINKIRSLQNDINKKVS